MLPKLLPLATALALAHTLCAAEPAAEVDARLAALTKEHPTAVAVLVAQDGKVLYEKAVGLADIANARPATLTTPFRIGSVTKQFTGAAILRLAEQKKLSLDDPLARYFPKLPNADKITIDHLLHHTSGLKSYTGRPDFLDRVTQPIAAEKLLTSFENDPPDFAPGAGWSYCNTGYFLLGEIVAQVSGQPFGDFLRTQFFEPLEMKDTGLFRNAAPPAGSALGYSFDQGKLRRALDWDMSWAGGAGALSSTVGDLHRWNEAVFGGRVLAEPWLKIALAPAVLPPGVQGQPYGCGWITGTHRGLPIIDHGGGLHGFQSYLVRFPAHKLNVAVLVNAEAVPPGLVPVTLGREIAEKFLAADLPPPPAIDPKVDPKTYADYAGQYDYGAKVMTITLEENRLYAQLDGQPRFEIFPSAPDRFFWKVVDAQVHFSRNEKGVITTAEHHQNGTSFKAQKLAELPAIKLDDAALDAVTGRYDYGGGAVLTITREGGQLSAQLTGQPKFPIYPKSATEFVWRVVPARVEFTKDAAGQVTKATHHQGGRTFDAARLR